MKLELIEIKADTIPLDGLFYEPEEKPAKGAIMICHGNTMNFYTGAPRFLPPRLCQLGFACLSFNRRGHDIMSIRDSRKAVGAAFQTTGEGIADNEFASKWLEKKGFKNKKNPDLWLRFLKIYNKHVIKFIGLKAIITTP